jgi:hypothetical protein
MSIGAYNASQFASKVGGCLCKIKSKVFVVYSSESAISDVLINK